MITSDGSPRHALTGLNRYLKTVTPKYVDIRASLQEIIETLGGGVLELVAASVDANHLFGNPLPGKKKELRVRYLVVVSKHVCLSSSYEGLQRMLGENNYFAANTFVGLCIGAFKEKQSPVRTWGRSNVACRRPEARMFPLCFRRALNGCSEC